MVLNITTTDLLWCVTNEKLSINFKIFILNYILKYWDPFVYGQGYIKALKQVWRKNMRLFCFDLQTQWYRIHLESRLGIF